MEKLSGLTSAEALPAFRALYNKCVVRDTPAAGSGEGIKESITLD